MKPIFVVLTLIGSVFGWQNAIAKEKTQLNIGFGSCAQQNNPQPIWESIATQNTDLFILMGDNVYIDSDDPKVMKDSYNRLANNKHYKNYIKSTPIMGIWDDHDYGAQDGGKDFSGKYDAKSALIEFFDYPELNELKGLDRGIYHTRELSLGDKVIRVIMLDTRWYRDKQTYTYLSRKQLKKLNLGRYQPNLDKSTTILGKQQWQWLEELLSKPSDLNIIVSGFPVLTEFSGWETWANFPHERSRLLSLIEKHGVEKTVILSGDIHRGEMSKVKMGDKTLYEITSSGLDARIYPANINQHRFGDAIIEKNFGLLKIKLNKDDNIIIDGSLLNEQGKQRKNVTIAIK